LLRTEKNIGARKKEAARLVGSQQVLLAESGIDAGFGVSLDVLEETYDRLTQEIMITREEAQYQALAIRSGADAMRSQAKDVSRGGTIGAIGSLLGGIAPIVKS
jgi:hypothetical protein